MPGHWVTNTNGTHWCKVKHGGVTAASQSPLETGALTWSPPECEQNGYRVFSQSRTYGDDSTCFVCFFWFVFSLTARTLCPFLYVQTVFFRWNFWHQLRCSALAFYSNMILQKEFSDSTLSEALIKVKWRCRAERWSDVSAAFNHKYSQLPMSLQ